MKPIEIVDVPTENGDFPTSYVAVYQRIYIYIYLLVGGLEPWNFTIFHILEMSSSQLTISHIFHRGRSTTNQNQMLLAICLRRVKFTQSDKLSGTPGQLPGFAQEDCFLFSP